MAEVKCKFCKKKINRDGAYAYAISDIMNWYFCSEDHYHQYEQTDDYDEQMLADDIYRLSNRQCNFPWLLQQIEFYHNEYGFKYGGMRYAVDYFANVDQQVWNNEYGLGQIFPKYYQIAQEDYRQTEEIKALCEDIEKGEDPTVVVEGQPQQKSIRHTINISAL